MQAVLSARSEPALFATIQSVTPVVLAFTATRADSRSLTRTEINVKVGISPNTFRTDWRSARLCNYAIDE